MNSEKLKAALCAAVDALEAPAVGASSDVRTWPPIDPESVDAAWRCLLEKARGQAFEGREPPRNCGILLYPDVPNGTGWRVICPSCCRLLDCAVDAPRDNYACQCGARVATPREGEPVEVQGGEPATDWPESPGWYWCTRVQGPVNAIGAIAGSDEMCLEFGGTTWQYLDWVKQNGSSRFQLIPPPVWEIEKTS